MARYIPFLLVVGALVAASCMSVSTSSSPSHDLILLSTWEEQKVFDVSWSPTQDIFYASTLDEKDAQVLWAYDVTSSQTVWSVDTFSSSAAVSPDGKLIAETHWLQGFVRLRDSADGGINQDLEANNCPGGNLSVFGQDVRTLIVGKSALPREKYSDISLWNLESGQCEKILSFEGYLNFLSTNTKGNVIAYGSYDLANEVITWDVAKRKELCRWNGDFGLFLPGSDTLVLSTAAKLNFINSNSCTSIRDDSITSFFTNYLDFASDGSFFITADSTTLQMRNERDGNLLIQKNLGKGFDRSLHGQRVFVSPDGNFFVVVFADQINASHHESMQLWQIK